MKRGPRVVASALALTSAWLCLTREASAIIGGEPSGPEQDGVLLLRAIDDNGDEGICTATLVGPNLAITARHCLAAFVNGQFSCSVRGELYDNPDGAGRFGADFPPERLAFFSAKTPRKAAVAQGLRVVSPRTTDVCQGDIAFVVLDREVDLPRVPLRLGRSAEVGEPSVQVGYGLAQDQVSIDYATQARAQRRDLAIDAVGPDALGDGPTSVAPRMLLLRGPAGCIGDSGGPLLDANTGALLAVYSMLDSGSCSSDFARNFFVHVPPFQALVDEAFEAAGCEPLAEASSETTTGSAGDGGAAGGAAEDSATPKRPAANSSGCQLASGAATANDLALGTLLFALFSVVRRGDRRRALARAAARRTAMQAPALARR